MKIYAACCCVLVIAVVLFQFTGAEIFDTKIRVAGPTVSILIGLYESLLAFRRGL